MGGDKSATHFPCLLFECERLIGGQMYFSEQERGLRTSTASGDVRRVGEDSAVIRALRTPQVRSREHEAYQTAGGEEKRCGVVRYTCCNWPSVDWKAPLQAWRCQKCKRGMTILQEYLAKGGNILEAIRPKHTVNCTANCWQIILQIVFPFNS